MSKGSKQIIAIISIIFVVFSSCATSRKRHGPVKEESTKEVNLMAIGEAAKAKNLLNEGFIIKKAKIEVTSPSFDGEFSFNARVRNDGDFLLSVKGPLGIEIIRIIAVKDSIFAIDRINKIIYQGNRESLGNKLGLPGDIIGIIFGDVPENSSFESAIMDNNDVTNLSYIDGRYKRKLFIRNDILKVIKEIIEEVNSGMVYIIEYEAFREKSGKLYPSDILIQSNEKMFKAGIIIDDIITPFNNKIEVILPGYNRKSL